MSAQKTRSQRSESPVSNQAQKGLGEDAPFAQRTGSYTLDIKKGELGIEATNTLHIYGTSGCACGHWAASEQGRCEYEDDWDVEATTWRLAGPMLALLIICLSLRMRQSRPRIREFLANWLGITVSKGYINKRLAESGRAASPLEEEFVVEIEKLGIRVLPRLVPTFYVGMSSERCKNNPVPSLPEPVV